MKLNRSQNTAYFLAVAEEGLRLQKQIVPWKFPLDCADFIMKPPLVLQLGSSSALNSSVASVDPYLWRSSVKNEDRANPRDYLPPSFSRGDIFLYLQPDLLTYFYVLLLCMIKKEQAQAHMGKWESLKFR